MTYLTPTEHEKAEWSRMAQAAYADGKNAIGHKYSVIAAVCRKGQQMKAAYFDELQSGYRAWLVFGEFQR